MSTATTTEYTTDCPAVQDFLHWWHEAGRFPFVRSYPFLDYDTSERKTAVDRKKYIALDCGTSGRLILEKTTGKVWPISAYGRPNKRWTPYQIEEVTATFRDAVENNHAKHKPSWWHLYPTAQQMLRDCIQPENQPAVILGILADFFEEKYEPRSAEIIRNAIKKVEENHGLQGTIRQIIDWTWRDLFAPK